VVDLQGTVTDSVTVNGAGTAVVTIRPTAIVIWVVSQVSVEMFTPGVPTQSVPPGAQCVLRKNGYLLSPIVPNQDAAGGDPAIEVQPSDVLTVEWSGCRPGDLARVLAVYETKAYS